MAYPAATTGGDLKDMNDMLVSLGVTPTGSGGESGDGRNISSNTQLPVLFNGRVVGSAANKLCKSIAAQLRLSKVQEKPEVPPTLEVAYIPPGNSFSCEPYHLLMTRVLNSAILMDCRHERWTIPWSISIHYSS